MLTTYKIELKLTDSQKWLIDKHIGGSRWAYNLFLDINKQRYEDGYWYMGAYEFKKWFNNEYLKDNPKDKWIKDLSSKSTAQAFIDADTAMKRFFKHISRYPHFRSYKHNQGSYFFVRVSKKQLVKFQRYRIKLPKIGWVRFKEYGYIPKDATIKQGKVKRQAGRYYLTAVCEVNDPLKPKLTGKPLGIDLGIKEFAILSDKTIYPNKNKINRVRRIRKRLRRTQRKEARQYLAFKVRKQKEGKSATDLNLAKTQLRMQRLYQNLHNIQNDYQNKIVSTVVRAKPQWVSIEDLNVKGMMKNKHLARAVAQEGFYNFRTKLVAKCQQLGIPVHLVNRFEPTSKLCHNCGYKKVDLSLADRTYKCPKCHYIEDRDINASLNIRDTENFELAY